MAKNDFKITTIIKTHNSEKTLCEVIEAIKDLSEIIIVDCHSTDDTIEIAKEYKTKIIYSDKNELQNTLNNAINEASFDWILFLEDDEIIPQNLLFELENYTENPKKNKFALTLSKKTFLLNKEIKAARTKQELRFFKKEKAIFINSYSPYLKITSGKVYKLNKNFKIKNLYILKYQNFDISKKLHEFIDENKILLKNPKTKKISVFIKPFFTFLRIYLFKRAFLNGRLGFIYATEEAIKKFIFEVMLYEKLRSGYDIWQIKQRKTIL